MKKLIIQAICAVAMTGAAFGQGAINWTGPSFSFVTAQTNSAVYSPLFGGGAVLTGGTQGNTVGAAVGPNSFYYELLVGSVYSGVTQSAPATPAGLSSWVDSGLQATNGSVAGRLSVISPNAGMTVNALSSSVTNNIMLVGWSANLGSTWSAALAKLQGTGTWSGTAFFGESTVGYIEGAVVPTSNGANIFGNAPTANGLPISSLLTQLDVVPAPEPTTMALVGLGGAAMLAFRRKNK